MGVSLKGHEVVEGVDLRQTASLDDAHEEIANVGAVEGAVEQTIFAMPYGHLQGSFDRVVIEWRPGDLQEQGRGSQCLSI